MRHAVTGCVAGGRPGQILGPGLRSVCGRVAGGWPGRRSRTTPPPRLHGVIAQLGPSLTRLRRDCAAPTRSQLENHKHLAAALELAQDVPAADLLIAMYAKHGVDMMGHLLGSFAFCLVSGPQLGCVPPEAWGQVAQPGRRAGRQAAAASTSTASLARRATAAAASLRARLLQHCELLTAPACPAALLPAV